LFLDTTAWRTVPVPLLLSSFLSSLVALSASGASSAGIRKLRLCPAIARRRHAGQRSPNQENIPLDSLGEIAIHLLINLGGTRLTDQAQLLPGTLDLLILRAVSLGALHGYGILLRIGQISGNALLIEQGALYPGLFRLVRQGLLKASWGTSENNRRAKFYELTAAGRKRLREETQSWNRLAGAIASALGPQPEEV
jgi:PadR family transcriptional regulator PadR